MKRMNELPGVLAHKLEWSRPAWIPAAVTMAGLLLVTITGGAISWATVAIRMLLLLIAAALASGPGLTGGLARLLLCVQFAVALASLVISPAVTLGEIAGAVAGLLLGLLGVWAAVNLLHEWLFLRAGVA